MRKTAFGLLALLISAASAAAEEATPAPAQPDQCDALYVPGAEKLQPVYLSVHIDTSGNLSRGVVVKSSGDAAMDKAALACLAYHTVFKGPREGATPSEFDWIEQFHWSYGKHRGMFVLPNPDTGQGNLCLKWIPQIPARLMRDKFRGEAGVKFRITTDGTVIDAVVTKSSGNQDIDDVSLSCVRAYKYFPAFQGGKRIEIEWAVTVSWDFDASLEEVKHLQD